MKNSVRYTLAGAAAIAVVAVAATAWRADDSGALKAIETAAAAEAEITLASRHGWGEVWGVDPSDSPIVAGAIETASTPDLAWGEVWGLDATPTSVAAADVESGAIETASIPAQDASWGEVWGVAAPGEAIATAATAGWGEVWGVAPTPQDADLGAIETATIPGVRDAAWGEVWGLE